MFSNWILISALSISTFLSRFIGIKIMSGRKMNSAFRLYFNYMPVAIMTALIIKQVLTSSNGHISISFPAFVGCITTAMGIKLIKRFLPCVIIGIIVGLLTRYFL